MGRASPPAILVVERYAPPTEPAMPLAARVVRARLLDIFPADTLNALPRVHPNMTKAEAAAVGAGADLDALHSFVVNHFGRLHQHVYLYEKDEHATRVRDLDPPFDVQPVVTLAQGDIRTAYFVIPLTYHLVVEDGILITRQELTFAWPVKIVDAPSHIAMHLAIMAKTPSAHIETGNVVKSDHAPTEDQARTAFRRMYGCGVSLDLNKGIKALWDSGEYDAPSVQYKRARATSKDVMDENFMVRRDDPALYAELADKPLFKTMLKFEEDDPCIDYFVADPSSGMLVFRRYSDTNECVDDVIRRLLAAN